MIEMTMRTEGHANDGTYGYLWATICSANFILIELNAVTEKYLGLPFY
jgi:hypothetical protein